MCEVLQIGTNECAERNLRNWDLAFDKTSTLGLFERYLFNERKN